MHTHIQEINAAEYESVVHTNGSVVLDFYSTECPPCEALAAKFEPLSEIYGEDVKFVKIFRQGNKELAQKLGVSSSPTLIFFKDGKETGKRLSGGIKRAEIVENLETMLSPNRATQLRDSIPQTQTECDVLVLGGGPAGLAAAIYTAQAKLKTIVVDRDLPGGQVKTTHLVSNYPGFSEPISGYMLMHHMSEQTKAAGAEFRVAVDVTRTNCAAGEVVIDGVETIKAKKIILATGSSPRVIGVKGEREYKGQGVSYCATCDAKYYEGKHVVVIGGGNSAIEESLFITKFAERVTVVHQFDKLQANKTAQEKAFANPKISFMFEHEPREFVKEGQGVRKVIAENLKTKELVTIDCDGVFVFAGMNPNLEEFKDKFQLDSWGYIVTDRQFHTSIKNVFAVGDVASKQYRQITTAVSDGTIAAMALTREIEEESAVVA